MFAIVRKELADYLNSFRFFILFLLMLVGCGLTLLSVHQGIRAALESSEAVTASGFVFLNLFTPSLQIGYAVINPFSLFIPIIGIALGFDTINAEHTNGTMSRVISQPVYRDGVINGKFIAGTFILILMVATGMLLIGGYGLNMIGVPPGAEEIIRLFIYFVITIVYGAFWMALAMLFSVLFRHAAGSLLMPLAVFLVVFIVWMVMGLGPGLANAISPVPQGAGLDVQLKNAELAQTLLRFSPSELYQESFFFLLNPVILGMGFITTSQAAFIVPNPLSLGQVLLTVWPHIVGLISLSVICFALSYIAFMKQEIRAT